MTIDPRTQTEAFALRCMSVPRTPSPSRSRLRASLKRRLRRQTPSLPIPHDISTHDLIQSILKEAPTS